MQRKSSVSQRRSLRLLTLFILLALVTSMGLPVFAQEAAPPAQPAGPLQIVEVTGDDVKDAALGKAAEAGAAFPDAPSGMSFFNETEPNDTAATANALPGSQVAVYGTISPATEVDFFSFTANAGDRVYAATQTQWSNGGSTDTVLDIYASDGTTVLETDDESGSFSGSSSAIGGTIIPTPGTYYVRVDGFSSSTLITPYYLHVRVQSGTPTAESEPNNTTVDADPLAASQWMSGTITATTDPDLFSFSLSAGDSVYIGLDMDPGRLTSNTNWNGRLGLGTFNNFFLVANDGSTTKPHAEAFFMTVQEAGTYYAYIDSTSATGLGANARYNLSVSIYPKQVQQNCTTFTSTDVPQIIGPAAGTATSTIVVPGTVTSSITDINATIVLTHSLMADLDVTLVGPTAASAALFTDIGSTATGGQTVMDAGLDDQAALPIGPFIVVKDIIYQPEQPGRLSTFNGTPAAGTWTLQIADDTTNTSGGRLQSWSLEVCGDPPPPYAIELNKTVGTVPAVCATTDSITVPPGGFDVYYCYTVRNTGLNTLNVHDLVDSELGTVFTGVNYALAPGATYSHIQQATIYDTVTNTGTWTAYNPPDGGPTATDSDTATVNVRQQMCPAGYNDVTVNATFFDNPFPPAGWTVTNTSVGCVAPGLPDWTNTNPGNRANLTGGVGPFAIADSDRCGSGSTLDAIMTTGMLDFTGLISPTVSFNTDYDDIAVGGVNDQALLDASTDGGATWSNLFTWDGDHRGPLLVNQALPGAGENDVQVRWHYASGTWDWWWQVDNAFITACEPVPANPAISLAKTVGTNPAVCATTDEISLPPGGGEVTYCYEVTNTGDVTFERHDLVDSELGTVLNNFPYTLAPGASAFLTATTTITVTTVNTATWTAYNPADGGFTSASATDAATVTVEAVVVPNIDVSPLSLASTQATNTTTNQPLTVANTGGGTLNWQIAEDTVLVTPVGPAPEMPAPAAGTTGSRSGSAGGPAPIAYDSPADFSEGFDDITVLPGWATQNNSSPLGLTNWFQGNDTVFPAQAGSTTSYIGANFNNTSGVGTISNWLMTPQITMNNGDTLSFWTRGPAGSIFPDRLQVRLSTAGASTNVGTLATDVGDFTTLLLDINPTLVQGGYPEAWTQYTITLSGLPANASGRIAWRYFVTNGGPSGANSDYIGIDTVEYTAVQAAVCDAPSAIPWLTETPSSGATAGGGSTPVSVGFDSTSLAAGTYTANLCVTSDDPDPGPGNGTDLVIVPVTLTVTAVTVPNIDVSPLSLSSAQAPNTTTQQQVNVGNTGGSNLTWSIFEDVSGSPDMVDWSDNFDSYATGSQLHGQGGWKGWFNDPSAGALASSAQARSAPNSADIVGASDLVHEYSGYTSGPWVYTAWQYAPTDMTGVSYFILLNQYDDAGASNNWSTQVQFDSAQNLVINDGVSGGTLPLVKGQWVEVRVEIDLTANTQAFYYNNQLLYQGTWTEENSGSGALAIGAVDLFANGASTVYYDDLSLAAPAQPVACDAPADIPWASVNPTAGTTPGGGSTPVNVTFDSTGLIPGVYTGNLCIDSNDPDPGPGNGTDLVIVPLTLTVQPGTAVTLSNLTADASQSPAPAGAPLAALPAVAGLAMAAFYALRRNR